METIHLTVCLRKTHMRKTDNATLMSSFILSLQVSIALGTCLLSGLMASVQEESLRNVSNTSLPRVTANGKEYIPDNAKNSDPKTVGVFKLTNSTPANIGKEASEKRSEIYVVHSGLLFLHPRKIFSMTGTKKSTDDESSSSINYHVIKKSNINNTGRISDKELLESAVAPKGVVTEEPKPESEITRIRRQVTGAAGLEQNGHVSQHKMTRHLKRTRRAVMEGQSHLPAQMLPSMQLRKGRSIGMKRLTKEGKYERKERSLEERKSYSKHENTVVRIRAFPEQQKALKLDSRVVRSLSKEGIHHSQNLYKPFRTKFTRFDTGEGDDSLFDDDQPPSLHDDNTLKRRHRYHRTRHHHHGGKLYGHEGYSHQDSVDILPITRIRKLSKIAPIDSQFYKPYRMEQFVQYPRFPGYNDAIELPRFPHPRLKMFIYPRFGYSKSALEHFPSFPIISPIEPLDVHTESASKRSNEVLASAVTSREEAPPAIPEIEEPEEIPEIRSIPAIPSIPDIPSLSSIPPLHDIKPIPPAKALRPGDVAVVNSAGRPTQVTQGKG